MATARRKTEQLLEQVTRSAREGQLPAARSLYQALLNLEPHHALALFRHGLRELQAGDADTYNALGNCLRRN